ncbi:tetratricopeptide repeat protein [bacterium]|nr:tetratricopeptide repeat protein [bacterium]
MNMKLQSILGNRCFVLCGFIYFFVLMLLAPALRAQSNGSSLEQQAQAAMQAARFDRAVRLYSHLRESHPEELRYSLQMVKAYFGLGQNEQAQRLLEDILLADTDYVPALEIKADMLYGKQQWLESAEVYSQISQKQPNHLQAYKQLMSIAEQLDDSILLEQAGREYRAARYRSQLVRHVSSADAFGSKVIEGLNEGLVRYV